LNYKSFHHIDIKNYTQTTWLPDNTSVSYVSILPSVGCSYNCAYCPYPLTYGNKIVKKNTNKIVDEIKYIQKYFGINGFYFRSIAIGKDRKILTDLCEAIIKNNLLIEWIFEARVDQMDEGVLKLMKKAGCRKIDFGVETGSNKLLKRIGKPGLDIEKIRSVFSFCNKIGIFPMAQMIIGLPGETKETIKETQYLINKINPVNVNFHICIPYPGTQLYDNAVKQGNIEDFDYAHYMSEYAVMKTEELTRKDLVTSVKNMRRKLMLQQFLRNKYQRKRILSKICKKVISKTLK
jgi:radical SAM superfamily enzyme YgiQ (UPF0313 family)